MVHVGDHAGPSRSVVRSFAVWGRVAVASLCLVAVTLVAFFVASRAVYDPTIDRAVDATSAVRSGHVAMLSQ